MPTSSSSYVLHENVFLHSSLAASATAAGSHVRNAVDWRTQTFWQCDSPAEQTLSVELPAPVSCDAFAVARHNLKTASVDGKIRLQYLNNDIWTTASTLIAIDDDISLFSRFNIVTATNWRIVVNIKPDAVFYIAICMAGQSIRMPFGMPKGFVPPRHNIQLTTLTNQSENGAFVGRSVIREGYKTEIKQPRVPTNWLRREGMKFVNHAIKKPFFFQWSDRYFPTDSAYCWLDGNNGISAFQMLDREWQSFSMKIECI